MKLERHVPRSLLSRWAGWFFVLNLGFYLILGLPYITMLPNFHAATSITAKGLFLVYLFLVTSFIGQFAIFAFVGCLIVLLCIWCFPRASFAMTVAVVVSSATAFFLVVDGVVFHLYHLHLAGVVWHVVKAGVATQVFVLSWIERLLALFILAIIVVIEVILARWLWYRFKRQYGMRFSDTRSKGYGLPIGAFIAACLLVSYTLMLRSSNPTTDVVMDSNEHLITMASLFVPYYTNTLGVLVPEKNASLQLSTEHAGFFFQPSNVDKPLQYPLAPLQCQLPAKKLNIVFIILDAWRADAMNGIITPHIHAFAENAWQFQHHLSGGDCTGPGIFSLFYSVPSSYWTAMLEQKKGPVLLSQLLKDHYQMGIYRSASMEYPAFDKTVFRDVHPLQLNTPGATAADRDRKITQEFIHFLTKERKPNKPFFGFLFYDTTHNYCEAANYPEIFQPAVKQCDRLLLNKETNPLPYINRYHNAAHFVDGLVGKVLATLKQENLLNNTVVILTADHGEQFNDQRMGYWGHASNFTPYQTHTPMIVYWPGKKPDYFYHFTSHYDVVPTLMQQVLGCRNPVGDYSVGVPLRQAKRPPFIYIGSYVDYGIVQKNKITNIYPGGDYTVTNITGHLLPSAMLEPELVAKVLTLQQKYYQKK